MEHKIEALMDSYGNLLWRTGIMMLGEPQDVQDMIQEVLLKYMQKRPVFHDAEHEKAWLLRVAVNLCRDMLRLRSRRRYFPIDELEPEAVGSTDAESREILEEIAMLPQKWKSVLLLHYIEGYSLKEISEILDVSENAVKKRMQRAKEALRRRMET
ncbi:MAG: RNA polymerase sigma factor [Lachnospiraceae bacterium]|nr:RNA polymerase sigma factor [Lachnospiraceae bacterium]